MSEPLHLRTAAFGGFNRQDVVDYIETTTRNHTSQLNAMRNDLAEAQESARILSGEKARADALEERCDQLAARVDELEPLEAEVTLLREQVERYQPQAEAYAEVKETLANIELEARARASQITKDAEEDAARKRQEAQALLDQVMGEYSHTGQTAEASLTEVIEKLNDLRASLSSLKDWQEKLKNE